MEARHNYPENLTSFFVVCDEFYQLWKNYADTVANDHRSLR